MKFSTFLSRLRRYKGSFTIMKDGKHSEAIRHVETKLCPLCQLALDSKGEKVANEDFAYAAELLHINGDTAVWIADSADAVEGRYRNQLITILGL